MRRFAAAATCYNSGRRYEESVMDVVETRIGSIIDVILASDHHYFELLDAEKVTVAKL
jgi:hypothetical protein